MSNRNLNGLNSSVRSLNGLSTQLKDGNAIKVSIKNEIDVNMKNKTTEQTTINNEDLFLLSDTTGKNIKYIKGLNLKQQGLTHIEGGTNINTSINSTNGDTIINLDATILLERVSIKKNPISTVYPINYAFIVNSTNSFTLIAQGSPASGGETQPPYQLTLFKIIPSTVYPFFNNIYSFRSGLFVGVVKINDKFADVITVNNDNPQYLIKDTNVNLAVNSILSVGSTGKISSTTPTVILSNLIAGNNLTKSSNTINLDATLTNITSINGYNANVLTVNNSNSQYLIKEASVGSFASGDFLTINSSNKVDNISRIDLNNSIVSQVFVSNGLTRTLITNNGYSSISISTSPSINLSDTMTLLNLTGQTGGNAILKIQAGSEDSFKPQIHLFQNTTLRTLLEYDKANNKFLIKAPTGLIELSGYNGTSQILAGSQNVEIKTGGNLILKVQSTGITCSRILKLNQQRLDFTTAGVHYMEFNGSSTTMDGILLSAFGGGSSTPKPFFRANCSDGNGTVFEIYKEKISMYKPLHFKTTNDARLAFLQFKEADGMNGILLKAFGINATNPATRRVLFRVECSDANVSQPILLDVGPRQVEVYKRLSVIKDTSTIQNDNNDIFTVRNAGFVKAILHSDNNTCELAFKTNNQQSTLVYTTGGHFSLTTQNDINLVNSSGKCIFQSDRNLVVYRENNSVAFAASSNGNSSRDYKDNIIDLEENESINIIKTINPVSFTYKPAYWDKTDDCNNCGCKVRRGFIWEDVKPILPTACSMIKHNGDDDGSTKMLYKEEIIPDLVKTVQYLLKEIDTLKQQLENLNSK